MQQYKELLKMIIRTGEPSNDRTGTGTYRIFGTRLEFDLQEGFPLVTTKHTPFRLIAEELLWFIRGETNIQPLLDKNVHIWDAWANESKDLGPVYGAQWRNAGGRYRANVNGEWRQDGIDQLQNAIDLIITDPYSRRIIVDSWQVLDLPYPHLSPQENADLRLMALAPCHMMFQFFVHSDDKLDLQIYQRSVDSFLGLPFNIASYALLIHIVANVTNKIPGKLIWIGGDTHVYKNHLEQVEELLTRDPYELPILEVNPNRQHINSFTINDFKLLNYISHPAIKGEISV